MNKDGTYVNCGNCGAQLKPDDKLCPQCGSTKKAYKVVSTARVGVSASVKATQKRKGHRIRKIIGNVLKPSVNPKLKDGVREDRDIDSINDKYDQIVRDAKTGEIIHEEHTTLTEHNRRSNDKKKN
jgi:hypothetical protein